MSENTAGEMCVWVAWGANGLPSYFANEFGARAFQKTFGGNVERYRLVKYGAAYNPSPAETPDKRQE